MPSPEDLLALSLLCDVRHHFLLRN